MSADKLVRMANEIAAFFKPYPEPEAVVGIHDHIQSFWTPKMVAGLRQAADEGAPGLDARVVLAARYIPPAAESPTSKEAAGPAEVGEIGASDAG